MATLQTTQTSPAAAAHPPRSNPQTSAPASEPSTEEIREYAKHLYVQRGSQNGYAHDDWLEAEACLRSRIPMESSRTRMHHHTQITERAALGLVKHGRS